MGDAVDLTLFNALSLLLPPVSELQQDLESQLNNERRIINTILDPKIYDVTTPADPPAEVLPLFFVDHVESLNEEQQLMILHGGLLLIWRDKRVVWNASEYGNIQEITRRRVQFDGKLWLPKVYLTEIFFRTANILNYGTTEVTITNMGHIRCMVNVLVKTSCFFEYDEYPYDTQNCSFTMYSPFTIEKMKFTDYGGAEKTHYQTRSGTPSKIDVGDFSLEKIEAKNIFLIPGSKVVESVDRYPKRMVRSVFWFNLVFRRHNIFYTTRMAMPLFTISCLTYAFCLLQSEHGLIWLLLCLAVQIMNGAILLDNLPPDYTKMPTIGFIATLVLFETVLLIMWRFFTIFIIQSLPERADIRARIDLIEKFLCVYFIVRIIHIYVRLF
ncbi:Neurotransmitter-gated ion-channel ligand binding domain protein [Oesophagostomum dentatum]|uniref:Neurotransmitter-gated ion-channel ligand binding domain protein n=1 Tax=Oesophagostomum dentatum TaxID=61180 RepID=A0A0B1TQZ1_OESDE|nr:Neurotransmitter-gated ion-channel ligand binding domain protein [Oesophagostomum dentatum]